VRVREKKELKIIENKREKGEIKLIVQCLIILNFSSSRW
jgi:hypothetical protein